MDRPLSLSKRIVILAVQQQSKKRSLVKVCSNEKFSTFHRIMWWSMVLLIESLQT